MEQLPDIRGFLLADTTIAGLVGHGSPLVYQLHPIVLDEGAELPAITYSIVSIPDEEYQLDDGKSAGIRNLRIQIDCWAMSYSQCDTLSWAVRNLFNGFAGMMGSVKIGITTRDNVIDEFEPDRKQYRRILDFVAVVYDS